MNQGVGKLTFGSGTKLTVNSSKFFIIIYHYKILILKAKIIFKSEILQNKTNLLSLLFQQTAKKLKQTYVKFDDISSLNCYVHYNKINNKDNKHQTK